MSNKLAEIARYLRCDPEYLLSFSQLIGLEPDGSSSTLCAADIAELLYKFIETDLIYNGDSFFEEGVHLTLFCSLQGIIPPPGLVELYDSTSVKNITDELYRPDIPSEKENSLSYALRLLNQSESQAPSNLLPLIPVDNMSIACVVCEYTEGYETENAGKVIRWHVGTIEPEYQGAVLDNDVISYLQSVAAELQERPKKLHRIKEVSRNYKNRFGNGKNKPKSWDRRPIQLACQNVIIGMADFQHDSRFEGLRVSNYLTCEVPHLATHEANRAMASMMLCDAFQCGGTMEVRFGSKKKYEEEVPPALKRFGRSLGIKLGSEDPEAITPKEARELFLAITRIPEDLNRRVDVAINAGFLTPERICFTLLASIWPAIELDYLLATSSRAKSILEGGAPFRDHSKRLAEQEVSRAALMAGMLFRRLDTVDPTKQKDSTRGFSDNKHGVNWKIDGDCGVISYHSVPTGTLTWSVREHGQIQINEGRTLLVVPRGLPIPEDCEFVRNLAKSSENISAALLVPSDLANIVPDDVPLLACPDRLSALDNKIEDKLMKMRLGRS